MVLGTSADQGVEMLKQPLVAKPILLLFSSEAIIEVHTDACKLGFGRILLQQ